MIRAKVQLKSPMRTWSNSKSEGKLFSFDLVDETGEIRVTAFRDTAEKFYDIIEVDKVYFLSRASIKVANKQFNTLKNDYEMTLNNESVIQECMDVVDSIPETKYEFLAIDKLAQIEPGTIVGNTSNPLLDLLILLSFCSILFRRNWSLQGSDRRGHVSSKIHWERIEEKNLNFSGRISKFCISKNSPLRIKTEY